MLNIVFASDDNYVSLLMIAAISLLENNVKDFDLINIYILDDGISKSSKQKINSLTDKYSCKINFIKTKDLNSLNINIVDLEKKYTGVSLTTYARLFLSSLLPDDLNKVIYLDCDAIIMDSFKDLWGMDITDYYCAGVLDTMNETIKGLYGFNESDEYINAGFLFVNLEKWRNDNVEQLFIKFLYEHQNEFYYHDQGVINNVFKNRIKIVEPKYNLQFGFQYYDYDLARKFRGIRTEYYTKKIVDESRDNPVFLHFCGHEFDNPWRNKDHKYNAEFIKYAKLANCEDIINYVEAPSLKSKLFYKGVGNPFINLILKIIPANIVRRIIVKNGIANYKKQKSKVIASFNSS